MLDQQQVINGLAILLSFFVGYKYASKVNGSDSESGEKDASDKAGPSQKEPVSSDSKILTLPPSFTRK
jgi:hypothetical protein